MKPYREENLRKLSEENGYSLAYEKTATSTLDLAKKESLQPLLAITDHQTQGRGRYGHAWKDKRSASILLTLKEVGPDIGKINPDMLAHLFLLSVCNSLSRSMKTEKIFLKWPNDLILNGKKLGGTLVGRSKDGKCVLLSLGLNVSCAPEKNSSYLREISIEIDREKIIGKILSDWKKEKKFMAGKKLREIVSEREKAWRKKSWLIGKKIRLIQKNGRAISGKVENSPIGKGLVLSSDKKITLSLSDYAPGTLIKIDS